MQYVIIGGDAAGMSAAMQIYKYDREANITIIEKGEIYSYAQCGIPYVISGDVPSKDHLIVRSPQTYREKFGMNALVNHEVHQIDTKNQMITGVQTKTKESFEIQYDKLLIASGASPNIPDWEGIQFSNVHTVKSIPDMEQIMNQLTEDVKHVTIIGGGYIGLEMAESFHKLDKHVKIINRGDSVGKIFDKEMATYIHQEAKDKGVELVFEENTIRFDGNEKAEYVITDKTKHETDLVIISIGISPNTNFLLETDVELFDNKAVVVNEQMETNVKNIYAAGDCATQFHRIKNDHDYIPLGTTANKQGRIAGMNMVGQDRKFKGVVGSSILKFLDLSLGKTGLSAKEAEQLNLAYKEIFIKENQHASYYPDAKTLCIKLIYHQETMQLLGGQIIGAEGVDKRVDLLAVALFNEMTMQDLEDLDLSYAPPYNGVWDPVQRAARKAEKT